MRWRSRCGLSKKALTSQARSAKHRSQHVVLRLPYPIQGISSNVHHSRWARCRHERHDLALIHSVPWCVLFGRTNGHHASLERATCRFLDPVLLGRIGNPAYCSRTHLASLSTACTTSDTSRDRSKTATLLSSAQQTAPTPARKASKVS